MKKIVTIILASILIISCDDYLVPSSSSVYSEDMTFSNLDFAEKAVNGVYQILTADQLYNYGIGWFKVDSDIEFVTGASDGSFNDVSHLAATENASILSRVWTQYFIGIERANVCIKNLPESPMWTNENADKAKLLYGEAIALRAFLYFDCIRYWGDIPFSTEPQNEEDLYSYKTDRDSIYEYLIQDLKDVEDFVPWMSETGNSTRITKGFVKGLRARMALAYAGFSLRNKTFETRRGRYWEDYYKVANQECKEIIESAEHALNPSFEGVFKTIHEYSMDLTYREVLYEVGMSRLNGGRCLGYVAGMYSNGSTFGSGGGTFKTSPAYYYSFENKDLRRNVSVELYRYIDAKQTLMSPTYLLYPSKWRRAWLDPNMGGDMANTQHLGLNWPIMRYSDILLMYAETENEINNGPTQAAKDALALVRQRAFEEMYWDENVTQYIASISGSKEDFFNAIVDERAWEFGGEFMRKDDLIRWNLFGTKVNEMKEDYIKIIHGELYPDKVSNYIFWKNNGNEIDILNPDKVLPDAQQTGYTRSTWYPKLSQGSIDNIQKSLDYVANGYDPVKNNHLLYIENSIISASRGTLSNDQIPE